MVPVDQVATTANDVSLKWYDVILTIRSLWQTSKQILYMIYISEKSLSNHSIPDLL